MEIKSIDINWITLAITIILMALKMDGVINISWIWAVSPIWIMFIFSVIVVIFVWRMGTK